VKFVVSLANNREMILSVRGFTFYKHHENPVQTSACQTSRLHARSGCDAYRRNLDHCEDKNVAICDG